ncbi:MAG: penicillin-binding protein, partial [Chloroflexi bacterium]|nr:penicillin-binding protein [Chloroflexota bacterium]
MHVAVMRRRLKRWHKAPKNGGGLAALRFGIVGLLAILLSFVAMIVLAASSVFAVYAFYVQDLPPAEEIGRRSMEGFQTTRIYDRTGQTLLYELIPETGESGRRTMVPLSQIPEHLRNATIAMEDKTFYTNPGGINIEGFGRAVWGVVSGDYAGGGSSITQQLVRNVIMTFEERADTSPFRKIKEMVLSYELTRVYPGVEGRDRILELYLNNVFYGHFAFGVEAAAQTYFGRPVEELSLAECAMLVPLGNSPTKNPIDQPEEAKARQEIVLDQMFLQGYITADEAQAAKAQPLVIAPAKFDILYPHFSLYVRKQLEQLYVPGLPGNRLTSDQLYGGGLDIITTLDIAVQDYAQQTVSEQIADMKEDKNANNAAVVVLDAKTGEILAMIGSADYTDASIDGQVNMATSPRSPGSSIKPITYATAFAQGYTPATMLMDVRTSFDPGYGLNPYVPENYARTYRGPITVRRALAGSLNIPAVEMLLKVGYDQMVATAHAMGITTMGDNPVKYPDITLGGEEVTVLDMAYAFSVFANSGTMIGTAVDPELVQPGYRELEPVCVKRITDSNGQVLFDYTNPQRRGVLSPQVAFLVNSILSDSQTRRQFFSFYANMDLSDRPVAAKTGTNNDFVDAWTVGYTPQYCTAVWVGNADTAAMHSGRETSADGSTTAAPIWKPIMEYLHQGKPVEPFDRPEGIVTAIVDGESGKLPTSASPSRIQEVFIEGTVPTEQDDMHKAYKVCRATGKLANEFCPADQVDVQVFTTYPAVAQDWVREQ